MAAPAYLRRALSPDLPSQRAAAGVEDRYYLSNAEGVFAVASRSGVAQKTPEVRYVLTDRLGSIDVITDATGSVEHERRSYDAFGKQRNAAWGKPLPPPSGPPATTALGFTGHELDAELGLVNAEGRLYDPKLGRFVQIDPLQTDLLNSQRWNSYSYALNNPLRYTDPTGWDEEDQGERLDPMLDAEGNLDPAHGVQWHCSGDGTSCTGEIKSIAPAAGPLATAQTGSAAEDAGAPVASIDLDAAVRGTAQGEAPAASRETTQGTELEKWMSSDARPSPLALAAAVPGSPLRCSGRASRKYRRQNSEWWP